MVKIDEYIWECACKQIRHWLNEGLSAIPIPANVSRIHLEDSEFLDKLEELIKKYDIPRQLLELEITESVENVNINETIQLAKDRGFR